MLWAIDVGNTHTVVGLWNGRTWEAVWRRSTDPSATEDELAAWIKPLCDLQGLSLEASGVVCASVVPPASDAVARFCLKWLRREPDFVVSGEQVGLPVVYSPPSAVGADRIANALGALEILPPPLVVVDFGTATTFDAVDSEGRYVGGAILPGIEISSRALVERTAKLPPIQLVAPERAIGGTTVESLRSGIVLGYAGAVDALATRISTELGGEVRIVATGGLGALFSGLCSTIERHEPDLTLNGLRIAYERLGR